jgi:hypothetical protein
VAADSKIDLTGAQRDRIVVAIEDAQEVLTETERGRLLAQLTPDEARRLEELARTSIESAMDDTLLAVVVLLGGMGLLTTFLPSKGRDVPPTERLPSL